MNITRIVNRAQREGIFAQVHNADAGVLSRGDVVALEVVSNTPKHVGKSVVLAGAASVLVYGVITGKNITDTSDIPVDDYGIAQIYGFNDFVLTDGSITEGAILIAGAGGVADVGTLGTNDAAAFGRALDADNASSQLLSAFIRCM